MAAMFSAAHGLPTDLDTWAKQTSLAIRLGQGRPMLAGPRREIAGAPPLRTKPLVAWSWLSAALLLAATVLYYAMFVAGT
jgi:type VI secretion system protein ImpK